MPPVGTWTRLLPLMLGLLKAHSLLDPCATPPSLRSRRSLLSLLAAAAAVIWAAQTAARLFVRRSPLLSYDTPTPDGAGIVSFDDYYVFSGGPDRAAGSIRIRDTNSPAVPSESMVKVM